MSLISHAFDRVVLAIPAIIRKAALFAPTLMIRLAAILGAVILWHTPQYAPANIYTFVTVGRRLI